MFTHSARLTILSIILWSLSPNIQGMFADRNFLGACFSPCITCFVHQQLSDVTLPIFDDQSNPSIATPITQSTRYVQEKHDVAIQEVPYGGASVDDEKQQRKLFKKMIDPTAERAQKQQRAKLAAHVLVKKQTKPAKSECKMRNIYGGKNQTRANY